MSDNSRGGFVQACSKRADLPSFAQERRDNEADECIIEDFLQQNAFSEYDKTCPIYKAIGMLKCIITLYECALRVLSDSSAEKKLTWNLIKTSAKDVIQKVREAKFIMFDVPEDEMKKIYDDLTAEIESEFQRLMD